MSGLSEIFLMQLKATAFQSNEVSIVQDNANSSCSSLKFFFDNRIADSSTIMWYRPGSKNSRWEAAIAMEDNLPGIPTRQDSYKTLMSLVGNRDESASGGDGTVADSTKDSRPKIPCRQSSGRDLNVTGASLPRIPRRQNSFRINLGGKDLHHSHHEQSQPQQNTLRRFRRAKSFSTLDPALAMASPSQ